MGCMEVELRRYRAEDLEAIFRMDEACFSEPFRFDRESMRKFAETRGAIALIAENVHGTLVGFAITQVEEMATEKRAYVVTLDVAPGSRRGGVGGSLMEESERLVALDGAMWIELHVFVENEGAIRFYERRGYRRLGSRAGFYGRGLHAWVYRKDLAQAG